VKKLSGKVLALGKICIIFFALLALFLYLPPKASGAGTLQTIFADPFCINGTAIGVGNSVTVNINISNGLNVWNWGVALKFNPAVLNCTGVFEGEFLKRSGTTIWLAGAIDNTKGTVGSSSASCTTGAEPGVDGNGQLMYATFKVKAEGISDIHLLNVLTTTNTGTVVPSPCQVLDKYTLIADSGIHVVSITHNATGTTNPSSGVPQVLLNTGAKSLLFNLTNKKASSETSRQVFCNVTIPKTLVWLENPTDEWTVKVTGATVAFTKTEDSTNTYIYFTTTYTGTATTTKLVEIIGTAVIPEFQPLTIILILTMLAIAIITARRRLLKNKL